ncbi:hypothetical protein NMG60_11014572 [Bertholletia excelsa]
MEIHKSEFVDSIIGVNTVLSSCSGRNLVDGFNRVKPISNPHDRSLASNNPDPGNLSPSPKEHDFTDAGLKYISQMLMEEEDLEHKPCMFQDTLALQAAEKSFYDVLGQKYPPSQSQSLQGINSLTSNFTWNQSQSSAIQPYPVLCGSHDLVVRSFASLNSSMNGLNEPLVSLVTPTQFPESSRAKRIRCGEEDDYEDRARRSKRFASSAEASSEQSELYDAVLTCLDLNPRLHQEFESTSDNNASLNRRSNGVKPKLRKQEAKGKEVVDLRTLLSQSAQAVSSADLRTANDLLCRIRHFSSPCGDGTERLANYFANALEARLSGTGAELYSASTSSRISAADILKRYQVFVQACPFNQMSNFFANKLVRKLAQNAEKLHIIDFGILHGFQWPCLIQHLSERPGGPPLLRITGVDFPQPGVRPEERVEETGCRLASYCERFNVPFEYTAIAKRWESIEPEDLKIGKDEVLVVNCLYWLRKVPDETVAMNSPRDDVLNLIKRLDPNLFIHGIVNGTYNVPFFVTRFREALFHFSALFDMFEANVPRGDQYRMLFEKEVFGREVMNVIACEGSNRIERPETYKQWQVRNTRAGFRHVALDQEIMNELKAKVRVDYSNEFMVNEDSNWMLQGWKGRIILAISCWKPA